MHSKILKNLTLALHEVREVPKLAVADVEQLVLRRNLEQLRQGKNKTGGLLSPPYSFSYLLQKRELNTYNAPDGTPDLFVSGDFHKSLFVKNTSDFVLTIESDNTKIYFDRLFSVYAGILGLTDESKNNVLVAYIDACKKRIKQILK